MNIAFDDLASVNLDRRALFDRRVVVKERIHQLFLPGGHSSIEKLLLEVSDAIPIDAADEVFKAFSHGLSSIDDSGKARLLSLASFTTLSNLLDDVMEMTPSNNLSSDITNVTINFQVGSFNLNEIIDMMGDYLELNGIVEKVYFKEIVNKILEVQIRFNRIQNKEMISLDDALIYRSGTLGNYYNLLENIVGEEGVARNFSQIQMDDDIEDIDEDVGVQVNPFNSFCMTYSVKDKETILMVLGRSLGLPRIRSLIKYYEYNKSIEPVIFRQVEAWFNNPDFIVLPHKDRDSHLYRLFKDYVRLEEFYTINSMKI